VLDAVLHLASCAVQPLIQPPRFPPCLGQRRDDVAWVGLVEHVLGFTDDSPPTAPAVQRRVSEVAKHPSRLARPPRLSLGFPHRRTEPLLQALVPSQSKDIVYRDNLDEKGATIWMRSWVSRQTHHDGRFARPQAGCPPILSRSDSSSVVLIVARVAGLPGPRFFSMAVRRR